DFRAFLVRHVDLLGSVDEWTIRILVPKRFWNAVALHKFAIRDTYIKRLTPAEVEEFDWFCRLRRGLTNERDPYLSLDPAKAARKFGSARFRALERVWERGASQVSGASSTTSYSRSSGSGEERFGSSFSRTSTSNSRRSSVSRK